MEKPKIDFKKTKCIYCKTLHKKTIWGKYRYLNEDDIKKKKFNFIEKHGFICNKKYLKIKKKNVEEDILQEEVNLNKF
jgi:hypothetical protein